MKILNLYAGIGGNRRLWGDEHDITAVEWDKEIAAIYKDFYPNDTVIVADANQYLLDHYKEYDFIWSSPPCPSHSQIRRCGVHRGQNEAIYPDMVLYQEIIVLRTFAKCNWVVENVIPYYSPLITGIKLGRHLFWSNLHIPEMQIDEGSREERHKSLIDTLTQYKTVNKQKLIRNMVNPKIGKYLLDIAMATPFKIDNLEIDL